MLRTLVAAALVAATAVPAQATLRYCQDPVDAACFSGAHDKFCQVYVREWCVNVVLPGIDKPIT